jgi:hypothetical protein
MPLPAADPIRTYGRAHLVCIKHVAQCHLRGHQRAAGLGTRHPSYEHARERFSKAAQGRMGRLRHALCCCGRCAAWEQGALANLKLPHEKHVEGLQPKVPRLHPIACAATHTQARRALDKPLRIDPPRRAALVGSRRAVMAAATRAASSVAQALALVESRAQPLEDEAHRAAAIACALQ